ncbi:hypothetical protein GCM10010249_16950 [Streptomyces roseolilacinus]|uniref:Uncharacterized protein n=1 Tax=Streptomyces roseolilacinus TaxID=66904 RepID=A0A918B099_9ACTN|nr:hypothetical protein GCM10010249_16950 [Streptomyces roseolilacinus]
MFRLWNSIFFPPPVPRLAAGIVRCPFRRPRAFHRPGAGTSRTGFRIAPAASPDRNHDAGTGPAAGRPGPSPGSRGTRHGPARVGASRSGPLTPHDPRPPGRTTPGPPDRRATGTDVSPTPDRTVRQDSGPDRRARAAPKPPRTPPPGRPVPRRESTDPAREHATSGPGPAGRRAGRGQPARMRRAPETMSPPPTITAAIE